LKIPSLVVIFVIPLVCANAQVTQPPLSQRQACERFTSAVVRIEAGGKSRGTGFLVTQDGFILTAGHVITDPESGKFFSAILVSLPSGASELARVVIPMTLDTSGQDYAILKVDGKDKLPFIPLGTNEDIIVGSNATIVGYPFSAITVEDRHVSTKFCLSAIVAASDLVAVPIRGTKRIGQQNVPVKADVKVNVIYFQGPSVKGVSGAPLISLDTGNVIGIVTLKLTGIGNALNEMRNNATAGRSSIAISGIGDLNAAFSGIIQVLDEQLANGLGAAVGIDDPAYALKKATRDDERQHPKK